MLTYVEGDFFASPALVLVNTVNTVGVMGKGIAKEFKAIYPEMFERYRELCEREELTIGKLFLYRTPHKWVLNFPTKRHWRQRSRLEDIDAGLRAFVAQHQAYDLTSVAFPQLGCGNGELDWESQVRPLMERHLGPLPIDVYIHLYSIGATLPEHRDLARMKQFLRSRPADLPFLEVWEDIVALIEKGCAPGWSVVGGNSFLRVERQGDAADLPKDDVFDLWRQLRSFGFLAASDIPRELKPSANAILELLVHLDYVEPARFHPMAESGESTAPTSTLIRDKAARGIRLLPPMGEPASQATEFDHAYESRWTESPTTLPLQLSLTS